MTQEWVDRGFAHQKRVSEELREAIRCYERRLAEAPSDRQQGELIARTGRHEEALSVWQRALVADPETIGGHYSRAFLLERLGRTTDAAVEWEAILEFCRGRGYEDDIEWPTQLARLRGE